MRMMKSALTLALAATVLSGCSTFEKGDIPMCAAIGGILGAGAGATESTAVAGAAVLASA